MLTEKASGELQQRQKPEIGVHASQLDQEGITPSMILEKGLPSLRQRQSPDEGNHTSQSNEERSDLSIIPDKTSNNIQRRQSPDNGVHISKSNQEVSTCSTTSQKLSENLQWRQSPDADVHVLRSDQEGSTPSVVPEKTSEDGYNWRKYGQKLVKGNEFIRSYYKCTHPNCSAKRQVERSCDGRNTNTTYLGKHEHPKPQPSSQLAVGFVLPTQAKGPDELALAIVEGKSSYACGQTSHHIESIETPRLSNDTASGDVMEVALPGTDRMRDKVDNNGNPDLKRHRKTEFVNGEKTLVDKRNGESRHVVQTLSEIDIVHDGYRWRKYGQKLVKGNLNPRSYYRCSSAGCPAKKRVERASHDPKLVITAYEGQHDHDTPPARTITPNRAGANTKTTSLDGESY